MSSKVNRVAFWVGLVIVSGLLLAACGDSSAVSTGNNTTASSTTAPATTALVATTSGTTAPITTANAAPTTSAPMTTTASATGKPTTAASATTGVAAPGANANSNVIYQKDNKLWAYNVATGLKFGLSKNAEVAKYILSPDGTKVAFLFTEKNTLKLAMVKVQATQVDEPVILDDKIAEINPAASKIYGSDYRPFGLNFSPDGSQLAYSKENAAANVRATLGNTVKPTELWISDLAPNAGRKLVPNDQDFIARPTFSTDGNRISFLHVENFGTGAGYNSVLWSVYKDGSRLSNLVGPKLPASNQTMSPAFDFIWVGPKQLTFKVFGGASGLWLHDLDTGNPRPLALEIDPGQTFYDSTAQRYLYFDGKNANTIGVISAEDKPITLAQNARPLDFNNSTALYFDQQKTVTLASLNQNGTVAGSRVSLPGGYSSTKYTDDLQAKVGPLGGQYVAVSWSDNPATNEGKLLIYETNGQPTLTTPLTIASGRMKWLDAKHLVILGYGNGLQVVDITNDQPILKTIDPDKGINYQPILDF